MTKKRVQHKASSGLTDTVERRDFLKMAAAGAALVTTGVTPLDAGAQPTELSPMNQPGRVVKIAHAGAMSDPSEPDSDPVSEVVGVMVDTALLAYTGVGDIGEAWRHFVRPEDRVLIKINALGSPNMATNKPVVEAIIRGLRAAGVPAEQMVIYDQYGNKMRSAGFRPGDLVLDVPIENSRGQGYMDDATEHGSGRSKFAVALEQATAVINVPVIKDHDICGVTMAFKNMTHGVIDNPSDMHGRHRRVGGNACTVHADIYGLPIIRDKVRLIVADGLRLLYEGGPQDGSNKDLHNAIYVSTDPVALDTIGHDILQEARRNHGVESFEDDDRPCGWLAICEERGLGVHDRARIQLEEHTLS